MAIGPAAPVRDPDRFAPVFVLAPARSYTSVISMMLGQHPQLVGLPELKLFAYPTMAELEASLPRFWIERGLTHRAPGLVRALAEFLFDGQTPAALTAARSWLRARASWSGADVLDCLLARLAPRIAVEKSPETVETGAALERAAAFYPQARYLHLTRHPLATQRSIAQHLDRIAPGSGQRDQPMAGVAAGWLGLRTDPEAIAAMRHPEHSPFARLAPAESGVAGGNDPAFLRDPIPHAVPIERGLDPPPGWSAGPSAWERVVILARYLGYS